MSQHFDIARSAALAWSVAALAGCAVPPPPPGAVRFVSSVPAGLTTVTALAVGQDGSLAAAGVVEGGFEQVEPPSPGVPRALVSRWEPRGRASWGFVLGQERAVRVEDAALAANGELVIVGWFAGTVDFDPTEGERILERNERGSEAFVARYDGDGRCLFAGAFTGRETVNFRSRALSVAVDSDGGVIVAGAFSGEIDFDPGPGTLPLWSDGLEDGFVVRLDDGGRPRWAVRFAGGGTAEAAAWLAPGRSGPLWVKGRFAGEIDLDPGEGVRRHVAEEGGSFLARLDVSGALVAGSIWPDGELTHLAPTGDGGAYVLGSAGAMGGSLVRLDEDGRTVWSAPVARLETARVATLGEGGVLVPVAGEGGASLGRWQGGGQQVETRDLPPGITVAALTAAGGRVALAGPAATSGAPPWIGWIDF